MIDPRHGSRLFALLRRVLLLPVGAALGGCCFVPFEDVVSGSGRSLVYPMPGRLVSQRPAAGTRLPREVCAAVCGEADECHAAEMVGDAPDASLVVVCRTYDEAHCSGTNFMSMPSGRRRMGRRRAVAPGLPGMAALEAESVDAFRELDRALGVLGAPPRMRARVRRAAADEAVHAQLVRGLCGSLPPPARATRSRERASPQLLTIALHNATEGCVGESWGALLALLRAQRDVDAATARVMGRIARDEARHAALSWELDAWLAARLSPAQRARVLAAKRRAAKAVLRRLKSSATAHALAFHDASEAHARAAHLFGELGLC